MAIHLGAAYVDIVPSTRGLGRELSGQLVPEVSAAGGKAGKGFGSRFASAVGGLVSGAATVAGATAGTLFATSLTKGFGRLKAIDAAQFKLKGLGHDAEAVEAIMGSALKAVEGTAFGLGDAATIAASAVAAGIKPGKELTRYLSLIGDTATIAGGSIEELGGIINGVTTTNQVYRRDLLQLANRGLPVFTWLQEAYGVTADELNKMVSDGKADAETFLDVIEKNIGGAALSAGESWSGMVANIGAAMGRFGAKVLTPLMDGFKELAPSIMGLFDELGARVEPVMAAFADSHYFREFVHQFERLSEMVGPALDSLEGLAPLLAPLAGFVGAKGLGGLVGLVPGLSGLAGALNPIVGAIAGLVLASEPLRTVLMDIFWTVANSFRPLFETLAPILAEVADTVAGVLARALEALAPVIPPIVEALGDIAGAIGEALLQILPPVADAFVAIVDAIVPLLTPEVVTALMGLVNPWFLLLLALEPLIPVITDLAEMFGELVAEVVDKLSPYLPDIVEAFGEIARVLGEGLAEVIEALLPILPDLTEAWADLLVALLPLVPPLTRLAAIWMEKISVPLLVLAAEAFTELAIALTALVTPVLELAGPWLETIAGWLDRLAGWAETFPGFPDIAGWFGEVARGVGEALALVGAVVDIGWSSIVGVITGAWETISGVVTGAIGAIAGTLDVSWASIAGTVSSVWSSITGAITGAWATITGALGTAVETISTTLSNAWATITSGVSSVVSTIGAQFTGLPQTLRNALVTVGEVVSAPFRAAWGAIARAWNSTVGSISFTIPSWVPGLGGRGFSMPTVPTFHTGGVVGTGITGDEAIVKVLRGEWILTPEQVGRLAGAGQPAVPPEMTLAIGGHAVTERDLVILVKDGLNRLQGRSVSAIMPGVSG